MLFNVGCSMNQNRRGLFFHGLIDDLRVWSYARTEDQIKENLDCLTKHEQVGLVLHWDFDYIRDGEIFDQLENVNGRLSGPLIHQPGRACANTK